MGRRSHPVLDRGVRFRLISRRLLNREQSDASEEEPRLARIAARQERRVFGQIAGLIMSVKGLPSTYNKDLQESFEPMLDGTKRVADSIQIARGVLSTLTIFPDKMKAALNPDMLATDLADYLVRKGVPFRDTHHISGQVVALAEKEGKPMDQLSNEQLQDVDQRFGDDAMSCFDYERSDETCTAVGGTSRKSVEEQIELIVKMLE